MEKSQFIDYFSLETLICSEDCPLPRLIIGGEGISIIIHTILCPHCDSAQFQFDLPMLRGRPGFGYGAGEAEPEIIVSLNGV
jgi:hypothetical protein